MANKAPEVISLPKGGWNGLENLSIPGIGRKSSHGIPRYRDWSSEPEDSDTFILSGAEDLVPVPNDASPRGYRYLSRTEGLFAWTEHYMNDGKDYWKVKSKDLISWYGLPASTEEEAAIIYDPANPTRIFSWSLNYRNWKKKPKVVAHDISPITRHALATKRDFLRRPVWPTL